MAHEDAVGALPAASGRLLGPLAQVPRRTGHDLRLSALPCRRELLLHADGILALPVEEPAVGIVERRVLQPGQLVFDLHLRRRVRLVLLGLRDLAEHTGDRLQAGGRSEEHTSELQSLMRISYAVFCLKKKKTNNTHKLQRLVLHTTN